MAHTVLQVPSPRHQVFGVHAGTAMQTFTKGRRSERVPGGPLEVQIDGHRKRNSDAAPVLNTTGAKWHSKTPTDRRENVSEFRMNLLCGRIHSPSDHFETAARNVQ